MKLKNKTFRSITLGLQSIAILAFFIPPLFASGPVGTGWLVLGVLHTAMFCAMFFRDARRRTALSIILLIAIIFWCLFLLAFALLILMNWMAISFLSPIILYSLSALLAAIFALAGPRKFQLQTPEAV